MRVVKIEEKANSESLSALLLKANLSNIQSEKALAALQALNPHVDITKVPAGTVLLCRIRRASRSRRAIPCWAMCSANSNRSSVRRWTRRPRI